jgi:hypothetical protein
MVSELIKLYLENFKNFTDNERIEIFKQICLDELGVSYDEPINIIYSYTIGNHYRVRVNYISIYYINSYSYMNIKEFEKDSNNVIKVRGENTFISNTLYEKIIDEMVDEMKKLKELTNNK